MSVELTISPANSPTRLPVWPPNIAPPICRNMPASRRVPRRAARAAEHGPRISGGSRSPAASAAEPPSCDGSSIELIASTPLTAIGSDSGDQTGNVASSHSDCHASDLPDAGRESGDVVKPQVGEAQRVGDRRALVPSTLGSPFAAMACRAKSLARSQFTGPPV